jgi:hypothetical protein
VAAAQDLGGEAWVSGHAHPFDSADTEVEQGLRGGKGLRVAELAAVTAATGSLRTRHRG